VSDLKLGSPMTFMHQAKQALGRVVTAVAEPDRGGYQSAHSLEMVSVLGERHVGGASIARNRADTRLRTISRPTSHCKTGAIDQPEPGL
jgi:hypothetical protein